MENRTYWFKMPRNFGNEYELFWEWNDNIPALEELKQNGYRRITRKEAFSLCASERRRAYNALQQSNDICRCYVELSRVHQGHIYFRCLKF